LALLREVERGSVLDWAHHGNPRQQLGRHLVREQRQHRSNGGSGRNSSPISDR